MAIADQRQFISAELAKATPLEMHDLNLPPARHADELT